MAVAFPVRNVFIHNTCLYIYMFIYNICLYIIYDALAAATAAPPLATAELAHCRVPRFQPSRSHSTTLKPNSFERFYRYLLNNVNRVTKFDIWQILRLSEIDCFRSKTCILILILLLTTVQFPRFLNILKCYDIDGIFYTASFHDYPEVIRLDFQIFLWFNF